VAGLEHDDGGVMEATLQAGQRTLAAQSTGSGDSAPGLRESEGAPVIDWTLKVTDNRAWWSEAGSAKSPDWQADFLNHLGQTQEQRRPNAKLRISAERVQHEASARTTL
jgi:hypothetical protein